MRSYLATFVLALLLAFLVTPPVARLGLRSGAVDTTKGEPIPRAGGVAILIATAALAFLSVGHPCSSLMIPCFQGASSRLGGLSPSRTTQRHTFRSSSRCSESRIENRAASLERVQISRSASVPRADGNEEDRSAVNRRIAAAVPELRPNNERLARAVVGCERQ